MGTGKQIRQYGLWDSPIGPGNVAGGVRLFDAQWSADGSALVWREERSGHGVLVVQVGDDAPRDLTDVLSVRARVGYGGGDFTVGRDDVYFVEVKSGRIYRQPIAGGAARPVTPAFGFASSPVVSPDGRWLLYVHTYERVDCIAVVDTEGRHWPQVLAGGHDFFMQPTWSADGTRAAWVAWDHPQMPWDGASLFVGRVAVRDGGLPTLDGDPAEVAGGASVSIFQPQFLPDNRSISYVSDETGWGALYVKNLESGATRTVAVEGAELGMPAWIQGIRAYGITPDGAHAVVLANREGFVTPAVADLASGAVETAAGFGDYTDVEMLSVNPKTGAVAAIAASATIPPRVVVSDASLASVRVVKRSVAENVSRAALSTPEPLSWTSLDGSKVYGLYFPPASERFESPGKPPLIVVVHGGPTSQVLASYSPQSQFLATRGYGVLAVNYRGSTGYGREYAQALRGNWGVYDVEDSVSGAKALADAGRIDAERTAIMGGSAGGFTVLFTMITHPEAFTVGVCLFGVANQFTLAAETHKFEERYTDSLLGPLPDAAAVYRERSPQFRANEIRRPLAIFQGEIDEVVLKNQSDAIVEALRRSGTPHEYHVYEGEGHGWRKAETIQSYYTSLERFLRTYLIYS